jgi:EAL domain-containing protein (putative c-di-GMP-specific phosphodiesterase class I)
MMRESRLTTHFQPIVFSRNTAVVFGHECLLRGLEAGELVAADELLMLARATGLVFELDHAARRAALFASAERKLNGKIFINVSLLALHHTEAFLRSLISAMEEFGLHRDQCVLEVIDTERLSDIGAFRDVLARLRTAQFEIALDDLGPSYSSLELIRGLRPDYIKLAYDAIHAVDSDPFKATIAEKLFEGARQYGARIIAECVESEGEYSWVRDHGADFIQGFYFARPATVPRVRLRLPVA